MDIKKVYTVWVGGAEVNDFYLNEKEAQDLAQRYITDGYNDVIIDKIR